MILIGCYFQLDLVIKETCALHIPSLCLCIGAWFVLVDLRSFKKNCWVLSKNTLVIFEAVQEPSHKVTLYCAASSVLCNPNPLC